MNFMQLLEAESVRERIRSMSLAQRRAAAEDGELTVPELNAWASLYPEEIPLVNGELPWIALRTVDLE